MYPHPKYTMSSPVVTIVQRMKDEKKIKPKIGVGYLVKRKVRKVEENKRQERSRSMRQYVLGYVQAVVGKKKFLVQF